MEKNTYQSMMAHIKMSSSCEEKILQRAAELSEQGNKITVKTKKKRRPVLIAAAACLCTAMLGTVTVSAFQDRGWISGFFRVSELEGESSEVSRQRDEFVAMLDEYVSPLNDFSAEGWNADKFEPVGAICNGEILFAAIRYTTPEEDNVSAEYLSHWHAYESVNISSNGNKINFDSATAGSRIQEDGSAIIYEQFYLSDVIKGNTVEVSMDITDTYKFSGNNSQPTEKDMCHVSFSVDITKKVKVITYYTDDVLKKEIQPLGVNACMWIEKAEVSAFYIALTGEQSMSHPYLPDTEEEGVYVITDSGEEIKCVSNMMNFAHESGECIMKIEYPMPLDPETVTAVRFGDQIIELDK